MVLMASVCEALSVGLVLGVFSWGSLHHLVFPKQCQLKYTKTHLHLTANRATRQHQQSSRRLAREVTKELLKQAQPTGFTGVRFGCFSVGVRGQGRGLLLGKPFFCEDRKEEGGCGEREKGEREKVKGKERKVCEVIQKRGGW